MFKSERFDYKSDLPAEYNAGNRFYGKDVADFLSGNLTKQGLSSDYLDEDWGWLIFGAKGSSPDFEVAVYNLAEHGEGGRPGIGEWGLWIRSFERKKLLGLLPKRTEVQVPAHLLAAVQAAVRAAGAEPKEWEEGPSAA
jgi:hypothetical protein